MLEALSSSNLLRRWNFRLDKVMSLISAGVQPKSWLEESQCLSLLVSSLKEIRIRLSLSPLNLRRRLVDKHAKIRGSRRTALWRMSGSHGKVKLLQMPMKRPAWPKLIGKQQLAQVH